MMGLLVRFMVWLVEKANYHAPSFGQFPIKLAGILTISGKRERIAIALKHDVEWDQHLERSWNKKGYWYHRTGSKKIGKIQLLDLLIEWRVGRKETKWLLKPR